MTTAQTQGLIGMLFVLGLLVLLVAPAVIGIVRDLRVDRELREAEQGRRPKSGDTPAEPRRRYFTTTVTHHS